MKTGLSEAGFFLNKLIAPNPFIAVSLSLEILSNEIPPNA